MGVEMETVKQGFFTITRPKHRVPEPEKIGFLYIMKIKDQDVYKIGTTKDIKKRKSSLSQFTPHEIEMVFHTDRAIPENRKWEKAMHAKWGDKNIKGEWFSFTKNEVNKIVADMIEIQIRGRLS